MKIAFTTANGIIVNGIVLDLGHKTVELIHSETKLFNIEVYSVRTANIASNMLSDLTEAWGF